MHRHPVDAGALVAAPVPSAPRAPHRARRLWELPPASHELLLGLALPPATLRATVARALARLHGGRWRLSGTEAEMLYSTVADLASRNAVSEALQQALAARHALAVQRWAALREPGPLQQAWNDALASGDVPAALWALLTHPLGEALQEMALCDARCWAFAQARAAGVAATTAAELVGRLAQTQAGADALRLRLAALQSGYDEARAAAHAEQARLRGEIERLRAQVLLPERCAAAAMGCAAAPADAAPATLDRPASSLPSPPSQPQPPALAAVAHAAAALPASSPPLIVSGRRVLCVGGMPGARRRYHRLVESAGGRFAFHDGGIEENLHRLDRALASAELVLCQAGCVNHEAYRRVKDHCRQHDKPCVFIERPSLSHFERALAEATAPPLSPPDRTHEDSR